MYTNAWESMTTWMNRQHSKIEGTPEDNVFSSYLPIATSTPDTRKRQAPPPSQPSPLVVGSTSSHVPVAGDMVYHSMTTSPLNYPFVEPANKFMTPLHVITSMGNERFPFNFSYPQDRDTKGGGLLKIASDAKSTGMVPPASSSTDSTDSRYWYQSTSSLSEVIKPTWRPVCQPTMVVAPITNTSNSGDDRLITKRPAPPDSTLPLLKKRRLRTTFSKEQVDTMERYFKISMYLNVADRKELAGQLGLEESQVKTWFQNRRMRWKRQRPDKTLTPPAKTVRALKNLQRPPAATQGQFLVSTPPLSNVSTPPTVSVMGLSRQFVVPTPPPSNSTTPPAVAGGAGQSEGLPWYPMLAPSTIYSQSPAPSVPTESCCPAQAVCGTPVFPHFPAGLGMHPWTSTNTIGPHGGAQCPPRHV